MVIRCAGLLRKGHRIPANAEPMEAVEKAHAKKGLAEFSFFDDQRRYVANDNPINFHSFDFDWRGDRRAVGGADLYNKGQVGGVIAERIGNAIRQDDAGRAGVDQEGRGRIIHIDLHGKMSIDITPERHDTIASGLCKGGEQLTFDAQVGGVEFGAETVGVDQRDQERGPDCEVFERLTDRNGAPNTGEDQGEKGEQVDTLHQCVGVVGQRWINVVATDQYDE